MSTLPEPSLSRWKCETRRFMVRQACPERSSFESFPSTAQDEGKSKSTRLIAKHSLPREGSGEWAREEEIWRKSEGVQETEEF